MSDVANGTWGTVSIAIPDWMADLRDQVNTIFEALNLVLEVVNLALEFAKTFLTAFIDPISAIVQAIIAEINGLIQDFRQIGFYIGGDYGLLTAWPFDDLRGGYQAFENRMIARLSDRSDPTRPDASASMDVLGFFTYLSEDASGVTNLVNYILSLVRLFGMSFKTPSQFPSPVIRDVFYGTAAVDLANPSSLGTLLTFSNSAPDQARVTWTAKPTGMKNPYNPIPPVGPQGFIVTVSTFEQPMALWYNRPAQNPGKGRKEGDEKKIQQNREIGQVLDGSGVPVQLFGGADMLDMANSPLTYQDSFKSDGTIKDGKAFVFGRVDPNSTESIPLEFLRNGDTYYFQRTFFVDSTATTAQWFTSEYGIFLNQKDLPHRARLIKNADNTVYFDDLGVGGTYYVRVAACQKDVGNQTQPAQWQFADLVAEALPFKAPDPFRITFQPGLSAVGPFSSAKCLTFPETSTPEYLNAIQSALMVLVLSRSDLPLYDEPGSRRSPQYNNLVLADEVLYQGVAKTATGLETSKKLVNLLYPDPAMLTNAGINPLNFRAQLRTRIEQLALDIYRKTGPVPEVEAAVVNATKTLRTVTWNDLLAGLDVIQPAEVGDTTLLGALSDSVPLGQSLVFGVAPNVFSLGSETPALLEGMFFQPKALSGRSPDFFEVSNGEPEMVIPRQVGAEEIQSIVRTSHPFFARMYQANVTDDPETGVVTMALPPDLHIHLLTLATQTRITGSYDMAPVFMFYPYAYNLDNDRCAAMFCRHIFRQYQNGVLYQEAKVALQVATAAMTKAPQDGEWIAIRMFDAFPDLDNFLSSIDQWVQALNSALESIADTIIKYIEFVQAAISDLQTLLRRINSLLQSFLAFAVTLPSFSGLMLRSKGTDNLLADFVAAKNKPQDSLAAYGAGIVVVGVSPIPLWLLDLIFLIKDKVTGGDATSFSQPTAAVGSEAVPPNPTPTTDPNPL